MRLGIFAKTFSRPNLEAVFDAVVEHGLNSTQFNMQCAGLSPMPDSIDPVLINRIRQQSEARGIRIEAISGTFNMIHPDLNERQKGFERLKILAGACEGIGTRLITLCTGTRDPDNMWRWHPQNGSPESWNDLMNSMETALKIAEEYDVLLGVEPEVSNVIDSAQQARRLLDAMRSPRLKVIMDGSNLFHKGQLSQMRSVLDQAFELVGADIALAHAKDLARDGEAGNLAAGTGLLDYPHYIRLLNDAGYQGALVLHGLAEEQVLGSVTFLRDLL